MKLRQIINLCIDIEDKNVLIYLLFCGLFFGTPDRLSLCILDFSLQNLVNISVWMGRSAHAWWTDRSCQNRPIFLFWFPIFAVLSLFDEILTVCGQSNRCLHLGHRQWTWLRLVLLFSFILGSLVFETLERIIPRVWKTLLWQARSGVSSRFSVLSGMMLRVDRHMQIQIFVIFCRVYNLVVWVARSWNAMFIGRTSSLFVKFWCRQTLRVLELPMDHLTRFVSPFTPRLFLVVFSRRELNLFGHWRKGLGW